MTENNTNAKNTHESERPASLASTRFPDTAWIDRVQPKGHRCSKHLDDLLEAVQTWPLEVRGPWRAFWACQGTKPSEPMPPRYQRELPVEYRPVKPERTSDPLPFLHNAEQQAFVEAERTAHFAERDAKLAASMRPPSSSSSSEQE
ncbi:hypothetical protein BC828DRAFT_401772 [Blastocladiella britannica]|nr:hypothetical protein BC828DRAFT_401772 [Blastocladiella britannica]